MKKIIHHLSRSSIRLFEITLGIAIVLMIGLSFALWQMSRQPFDLMFAEGYVARALSTEQYKVSFSDVDLKWPQMKGPLRLDIKGLELVTASGEEALSIEQVDVGLSSGFLAIGLIRPVSVYLENPVFRVVQDDAGRVTFLFQSSPGQKGRAVAHSEPQPLDDQLRAALEAFANPSNDSLLRRFRFLVIENARLMLEDQESGEETEISRLDARFRRTRREVTAEADLLAGGDEAIKGLSVELHYDRQSSALSGSSVFRDLGPALVSRFFASNEIFQKQQGTVNGQISFALDSERQFTSFYAALKVSDAAIYWPQEYDEPIKIGDLDLKMGLEQATQTIQSEVFSASVHDVPVMGSIAAQMRNDSYQLLLSLTVPEIAQQKLERFFPKSELDGELAKWLVHKMQGGTFRNVEATIPMSLVRTADAQIGSSRWEFSAKESDMNVAFAAEGVTLTYQDTLMPGEDIKASGAFDGKDLVVNGESGRIRDIEASNVKVVVRDVAVKGGGYADISLHAKGPLPTVLLYIADEPIAMAQEIGFEPDEVKGVVDADIVIGLPTVKDVPKEEVKVKMTGTLSDLYLPKVVEGLALSEGPLSLETAEGSFTLKGEARLDGHSVTLDMVQYFNPAGRDFATKIDAKITSDADLRAKFGVDLSDYISGDVPLEIAYVDNGKGRETVAVKGNLAPTVIHIRPFGYEKDAGGEGSLSLDATMDNNRLTKVTNLVVTAKDFSLDKGTLTFRPLKGGGVELSGGTIPTAKIGASVASADFEITQTGFLKIKAQAPVFDARPFLENNSRRSSPEEEKKKQAMTVTLNADQVLALNDERITAMKLYTELDTDGDITRLEIAGRAGESNMSILFRPDPQTGRRFFRMETLDGGALLAASGLYKNVRGGSLLVFGEPKADDAKNGNLYGTAQLENFRVVRAPALAKLLSLMSLTGVTQLLGQEGLSFSKFESGFEWQFRPQGNLLMIKDGRTSGSSVGLTFEGTVDKGKDEMDVRGTIIPMTEINSVLKSIPLLGEILTGGSGLIAATYTMKGPTEDPSVMINPLSVLAPGFLRKLLFEGGFDNPVPTPTQN